MLHQACGVHFDMNKSTAYPTICIYLEKEFFSFLCYLPAYAYPGQKPCARHCTQRKYYGIKSFNKHFYKEIQHNENNSRLNIHCFSSYCER
uniref:Uncharacterized protein n=1 Tax=Pararge aegeria TaxID=116150 RepID=S4NFW2_9NEOP